jgi:ribosomal protein L15
LFENKLIRRVGGVMPSVKILGTGEISKKLSVTDCKVSEVARVKIEKAGGSVTSK